MLERIKHLFNVPNAIFVISLDKQQLAVSLSAVYGNGINSEEYLRRFIDLEYALPKVNSRVFTKNLFQRFGFNDFFSARTHNEFRSEPVEPKEAFNALSDMFGLSLRAREQCFTRIRVAMMTIKKNFHLYPYLLTSLVILKAAAPAVYKKYALEGGTSTELIDFLRTRNGGEEFLNSPVGITIEAYIIARYRHYEKSPEIEHYREILQSPTASKEGKESADLIVKSESADNFVVFVIICSIESNDFGMDYFTVLKLC